MRYEDVFERFYSILNDPSFFKLSEEEAYYYMREWLKEAASEPYIRNIFDSISLDDEICLIDYVLKDSYKEDVDSDNRLVINIFAQYLKLSWMRKNVDSALNLATVIGGKEEKKIQSNYKTNIERLDSFELKLKKKIRDHGYSNGDFTIEG